MNLIDQLKLFSIYSSLILSACSSVNFNEGSSRVFIAKGDSDKGSLQNGTIYYYSHDANSPQQIINKDDYFSIKLISTFICNFRESKGFDELTETSNKFSKVCNNFAKNSIKTDGIKQGTRGEILIAANIGEQKSGFKIGFDLATVRNGSKVVYYNPDVRESGQLINAINLPVYGPKKYEGYPFLMDISVFELDNDESKEIKALLSKLAELGVAASANPLINNVVKPLGEALIGSNTDDLELRYTMNFDEPGPLDSTVPRMQLREGFYAIVRKEPRDQIANFKKLCVDAKTGLLLEVDKNDVQCNLKVYDDLGHNNVFRDNTWLLFRVAKEDPQSPAIDQVDTLEMLSSFLSRDKSWDSTLNNQQEAIQQLATNLDARAQISLIDKQIKTQQLTEENFKKTPEYIEFLLNKLVPIDINNTEAPLDNSQKIQLEINKNVIDRLSRSIVNMPCLPSVNDKANYKTYITNLKTNLTKEKISPLSQGSSLLKIDSMTSCN